MRFTFLILFILFLALANTVSSQWIHQQSGTTAALWDVKFINNNTGFISGQGRILKTTNAGENWIHLTIPPESLNKPLYCIHPVNENVIYCVGGFTTIIKSTNGGNNWQLISDTTFGSGSTYFTCFFVNENTGWLSGTGNKVLKTTNGGMSFDTTAIGTTIFVKQMYFRNESEGVITGDGGVIRKTTNGGLSWNFVNIPLDVQYDLNCLSFSDYNTGWIIGRTRKVFKTTDFGSNWDILPRIPAGNSLLYCADFPSNDTGYVAGQIAFKTTNGAKTWIQENFPNNPPTGSHNSITFLNGLTGWVCTTLGMIIKTTTGGESLVKVEQQGHNIPEKLHLSQNYPNPFNPSTKIRFEIPNNTSRTITQLRVYNLLGQEVALLVDEVLNPGTYEFTFTAHSLSSGIYYYKIKAGNLEATKRMVLVK